MPTILSYGRLAVFTWSVTLTGASEAEKPCVTGEACTKDTPHAPNTDEALMLQVQRKRSAWTPVTLDCNGKWYKYLTEFNQTKYFAECCVHNGGPIEAVDECAEKDTRYGVTRGHWMDSNVNNLPAWVHWLYYFENDFYYSESECSLAHCTFYHEAVFEDDDDYR